MNTKTNLIREAEKQAIWVSPIYGLNVCKDGNTFNFNSDVLSWTNPSGQYYLPSGIYGKSLLTALPEEDYVLEDFQIHLCNGGVPVGFEEHWKKLLCEADRQKQIRHIQAFNEFAYQKVKPLPDSFIHNSCFEVPLHGIEVKSLSLNSMTLRPDFLCTLSFETASCLGTFCQNNGIIAFYDTNGTYFVCSGTTENRDVLYAHGYKEYDFFVMFSNGERPVDEYLKAKLEKILCL